MRLVSATPVREHLDFLAEHGIGIEQVVKVAGVSEGCIRSVKYGYPAKGVPPARRISHDNSEKILAVMPSMVSDGAHVDATESRRMVEEMLAEGVSKKVIAEAIGAERPRIRGQKVTAKTAGAVKKLYAEWKGPLPTDEDPWDIFYKVAEIIEERNERDWQKDAACLEYPSWMWYPSSDDVKTRRAAKAICAVCPVRKECLRANLHEKDGIFGGKTARERRDHRGELQRSLTDMN